MNTLAMLVYFFKTKCQVGFNYSPFGFEKVAQFVLEDIRNEWYHIFSALFKRNTFNKHDLSAEKN